MHKAVKGILWFLGIIIALALVLILTLYIAGSKDVEIVDPVEGIVVVDAPFYGESVTMTWRVFGESAGTQVYVDSVSHPDVTAGMSPQDAGYPTSVDGVLAGNDYKATITVDQPVVYARVHALIAGRDAWSDEFPITREQVTP